MTSSQRIKTYKSVFERVTELHALNASDCCQKRTPKFYCLAVTARCTNTEIDGRNLLKQITTCCNSEIKMLSKHTKLTKDRIIDRVNLFHEMLESNRELQEAFEQIMSGEPAYVDPPFNGFITAELPANAIGVRWNGFEQTLEFKFKDLGPVYWARPLIGTVKESDVG